MTKTKQTCEVAVTSYETVEYTQVVTVEAVFTDEGTYDEERMIHNAIDLADSEDYLDNWEIGDGQRYDVDGYIYSESDTDEGVAT